MRRSRTIQKLRNDELVRICGMGHYIPPYIRHAKEYGYDCIWLDLEHRAMDTREIQALLAFFHLYDVDCLLRPPTLEKSRLYRYFEDGASGLMIPHVSTAEKAQQLVQAVKFPPLGDRGIDAAGLDADFSLPDHATYTQEANRETFLVVQIETLEAVENVDEIAAVEGVDGLFLGPGDLGIRISNQPTCGLTVEIARQKLADACKKYGKAWGQPTGTLELLQQLHAQGARLLAQGGDFQGVMKILEECSRNFDEVVGSS